MKHHVDMKAVWLLSIVLSNKQVLLATDCDCTGPWFVIEYVTKQVRKKGLRQISPHCTFVNDRYRADTMTGCVGV